MRALSRVCRGMAVALVAMVAFTACEDTIVNVPEPVAPELPPITITVTSAELNLTIGESQQVVANVTGSTNRGVTFTSGDATIAQVNASGVVTAMSAGQTTIIAAAQADPDVRAGVQVSVPPAVIPPGDESQSAELVIKSVTAANTNTPVNPGNVAGQINVTLAMQRGPSDRLEVLLNGQVVPACTQMFGAANTSTQITAEGLSMAVNLTDVICSINTAAFAVAAGQGIPTYANGAYTLSARLRQGAETLDGATGPSLTFNNADFVSTVLMSGATATNPATGLVWDGGAITVEAVPVSFTGLLVDRVGFLASTGQNRNDLDGSNGFSATFATTGTGNIGGITNAAWNVSITTVLTSGQPGVGTATRTIRLDNGIPNAGALVLASPSSDAWINGAYAFSAGHAAAGGGVAPTDLGVGGISVDYFYSTSGSLTNAQVVAAGQQVSVGSDIPQSVVNTSYTVVARVRDLLGNTNLLRIVTPQTDRFGVDLTAPTMSFAVGSPGNLSRFSLAGGELPSFLFASSDGISGFDGNQYRVVVRRWTGGTAGTCFVGSGTSCAPVANSGALDLAALGGFGNGYYQVTVFVRDQAGNISESSSRLTLRDHGAPTVSNITIPLSLTGGAMTTFTANAADGVDLASSQARLVFENASELPLTAAMGYGTYGLDGFVTSQPLSETIPFIRAIYATDGGDFYDAASASAADAIRFFVTDVAGNVTMGAGNAFAGGTVPAGNGVSVMTGTNTFRVTNTAANICRLATTCSTPSSPSVRTLTATSSGSTGTYNNPFTGVRFYYVDAGGNAQIIGSSNASVSSSDDGTTRVWSYSTGFSGLGLPLGAVTVFAVGFDSDGDALRSAANTALTAVN